MKKYGILFTIMAALSAGLAVSEEQLTFEDAVLSAVANNYDIKMKQAAVRIALGQYKQTKGATDLKFGAGSEFGITQTPVDKDDYASYYYGSSEATALMGQANGETEKDSWNQTHVYNNGKEQQQIDSSIWVQKLFKFGLTTKLSYDMTRVRNLYDYSYDDDALRNTNGKKLASSDTVNYGTVKLELVLPLFKSFNMSVTANQIDAAEAYLYQMNADLSDTISKTVMTTANAYWNYLLANKKVTQLQELGAKLKERDSRMGEFITAGLRSKNDLLSVQINEIENERTLLSALSELDSATLELQMAMGIKSKSGSLPAPVYDFPKIDFAEVKVPSLEGVTSEFLEQIINNRPDLQVLKQQVLVATKNLAAAKNNSHPDANLSFSIGHVGTVYDDSVSSYFSAGGQNGHGVNWGGALKFSMDIPNNTGSGATEAAMGNLDQANAALNKELSRLEMEVKNSIVALGRYRNAMLAAQKALELHEKLYTNEQVLFDSGLVTTEDLFNQDNKYIDGQLQYYQMMINYLQNVMLFKYYTGNLVNISQSDTNSVQKESLYMVK
jgi:outer membrane protein TolC